jgi:hypothetical protein
MDYSTSVKALVPRIAVPGAVVSLLAAAALLASASPAGAVTQSQLEDNGWDCIVPAEVVPGTTDQPHCARPHRLASFLSGEAKTATLLVFSSNGEEFLGTEFNIHDDLFHNPNRPCPTDPPTYKYTYLGGIFPGLDYWACHRFASDHL